MNHTTEITESLSTEWESVKELIPPQSRRRMDHITFAQALAKVRRDNPHISMRRIAALVACSPSLVKDVLLLLDFPLEIQELIKRQKMTYTNARNLRRMVPREKWHDFMGDACKMSVGDFQCKLFALGFKVNQ